MLAADFKQVPESYKVNWNDRMNLSKPTDITEKILNMAEISLYSELSVLYFSVYPHLV